MTQLCLLRHGQTDWNLEGRWQGHADLCLNASGLEQARRVADELQSAHFDSIYSSDLQRALATAQAVDAFHQIGVKTDSRLRELNMGEWEGKLVTEIPKLYPQAWADRQARPVESRPPGGESVWQLAQRVSLALAEICAEHPQGPVLVVSHGLALAVFLCHAQARPLADAFERVSPNARPVYLDYSPLPFLE